MPQEASVSLRNGPREACGVVAVYSTTQRVSHLLYFGLFALRQAIPRHETASRACAVLAVVAGALAFFPRGEFFWGTVVITLFVFSDLVDGNMARQLGRSSRWGAFLDSTLDRLGDAAAWSMSPDQLRQSLVVPSRRAEGRCR